MVERKMTIEVIARISDFFLSTFQVNLLFKLSLCHRISNPLRDGEWGLLLNARHNSYINFSRVLLEDVVFIILALWHLQSSKGTNSLSLALSVRTSIQRLDEGYEVKILTVKKKKKSTKLLMRLTVTIETLFYTVHSHDPVSSAKSLLFFIIIVHLIRPSICLQLNYTLHNILPVQNMLESAYWSCFTHLAQLASVNENGRGMKPTPGSCVEQPVPNHHLGVQLCQMCLCVYLFFYCFYSSVPLRFIFTLSNKTQCFYGSLSCVLCAIVIALSKITTWWQCCPIATSALGKHHLYNQLYTVGIHFRWAIVLFSAVQPLASHALASVHQLSWRLFVARWGSLWLRLMEF